MRWPWSSPDPARELIRLVEDGAYDKVAAALSELCRRMAQDEHLRRTVIEVCREVRQRGTHGPAGPVLLDTGLDEKTARARGPVVIVYSEADMVPDDVWRALIRDWRD